VGSQDKATRLRDWEVWHNLSWVAATTPAVVGSNSMAPDRPQDTVAAVEAV